MLESDWGLSAFRYPQDPALSLEALGILLFRKVIEASQNLFFLV